MGIMAEHLFSSEACEARRRALQKSVREILEEHRQELRELLRHQHEALRFTREHK